MTGRVNNNDYGLKKTHDGHYAAIDNNGTIVYERKGYDYSFLASDILFYEISYEIAWFYAQPEKPPYGSLPSDRRS